MKKYEGNVDAVAELGVGSEEMPDQTVSHSSRKKDFSHGKGDHRLANAQAMDGLGERLVI